MAKDFYTLQITYGGSLNPKVEEMKDLCPADGVLFNDWAIELRRRLYTTGFQIQSSPNAWEFISPFRIHTAILMKQDKKYNP